MISNSWLYLWFSNRHIRGNICQGLLYIQGPPKNFFFFFENALNKTTEYFLKIIFLFESTILQIALSAGHAVVYTIGPIFKHIIDCVQRYFINDFMDIIL